MDQKRYNLENYPLEIIDDVVDESNWGWAPKLRKEEEEMGMPKKPKTLWKFLRSDDGGKTIKSDYGSVVWKIGEWKREKGKVELCENGFHASTRILDAFKFVKGEILALVEVGGRSDTAASDKQAWSKMRLLKAVSWTREDSLALALYSAGLVLDIFEAEYPDDKRPRRAIEAVQACLKTPGAARAARAAHDAYAAVRDAYAAAGAAANAAHAATNAAARAARAADAARAARARDAADAAYAAANTAYTASAANDAFGAAYGAARAADAADAATKDKIESWLQKRFHKKAARCNND